MGSCNERCTSFECARTNSFFHRLNACLSRSEGSLRSRVYVLSFLFTCFMFTCKGAAKQYSPLPLQWHGWQAKWHVCSCAFMLGLAFYTSIRSECKIRWVKLDALTHSRDDTVGICISF